MTKRTTFTSIAFSLAIVSIAQVTVGPGARFTWVDAPEEFKFGYGLHASLPVCERWRLNAEAYVTPWEDVHYRLNTGSFNSETLYEFHNWGLNLDMEYDMGRRWFLSGGLGYSSLGTARTKNNYNTSESEFSEHWDRLIALNLGFGKRWKIGPGDLRPMVYVGALGYNFENDNDHIPLCETFGVSVSYQILIGKKH